MRQSADQLSEDELAAVARERSQESPGSNQLLQLQAIAGNQAVQRLIERQAAAKGIEEEEDEPLKAEKAGAGKLALALQLQVIDGGHALHLQRQPDAGVDAGTAVPSVPAPAGRATINYLPTLMDQTPSGWGVTTEDDVVIDVDAYTSGTDWKVKITTADQQAHQGVRLLPGVVEVTGALVAAESDCGVLQTMITSLNSVADQGAHSGFFMIGAVQAHENLHITQYRAELNPAYATFRTAVEALTVPQAGNPDAATAKAAIKALPAYTTAMAALHAADVAANNKTAAHTNMASFKAVEHGVVDPMVNTIKARRTTLKCA